MPEVIDMIRNKSEAAKQKESDIKPQFFKIADNDNRKAFENLLEENSFLVIHDNFKEQLKELIQIKSLSNQSSDIIHQPLDLTDEQLIYEGTWVYYPWLNKLVHLLDEEDFITVRTNRNQHKITKGEQELLRKKKIGIIGLSVGQSIAMTLVLERGCGEMVIADFDTLDLSNLNRIKTGIYNLGLKKSVQAAREIAELDPYFKITCFDDGLTENNLDDFLTRDGKLDLLIEECDSLDIKIACRIKARQHGIPVLMETNDRGMIDVERYDLDENYPLLHGLIGEVSWRELNNLTNAQKIPMLMKMTDFKNITPRQKLTVLEIGKSISTWPQLGSHVVLGAGATADTARRILLKQLETSGRFYIDVERLISDSSSKASTYQAPRLQEISVEEMKETAARIINNKSSNGIHISKETIETIVQVACMAPSSGNDQPWKFYFAEGRLFLFHEMARSYSFGDYKNLASYISLGGLIENVVLSAHKQQLEISVTLFPEPDNKVCIACFDFKDTPDAITETHNWDELYDSIIERCTNRKTMPNEEAPEEILEQLKTAAESVEGIDTFFIRDKEKLRLLGKIISACDRIRIMHPQAHYEFFNREIWSSIEEAEIKRTGMDIATLELTQEARMALDLIKQEEIIKVLREINGLQGLKEVSVPAAVNSAAMGLLETQSFSPRHFINGGRAMQRQWLKTTQLGYAYHPMVIPLYLFYRLILGDGEGLQEKEIEEIKELRKQFMEVFPGDENRSEVLLFRIFKADGVQKRSPRLPASEILYMN